MTATPPHRARAGAVVVGLAPCGFGAGPAAERHSDRASSQIRTDARSSIWDLALDRALHVLEAAWDCPPRLDAVVDLIPLLIPELHDARTAFEMDWGPPGDTFIADGRLCTLMPFCELVVAPRDVQVRLVLEEPSMAIRRLERLGLAIDHAQALWERSMRNAILALEDTPTEVSLVRSAGATAAVADPPSRWRELWNVAVGLTGHRGPLPAVDVPDETTATALKLDGLRRYWSVGLRGLPAGGATDAQSKTSR